MKRVKQFQTEVLDKGATLFISYPSFQDISFSQSVEKIKRVEQQYAANNFILLGTPERYMMPDSLMFDTSYHLTEEGADYRTQLLIEDICDKLLLFAPPVVSQKRQPGTGDIIIGCILEGI
jgi:hypothetical protein